MVDIKVIKKSAFKRGSQKAPAVIVKKRKPSTTATASATSPASPTPATSTENCYTGAEFFRGFRDILSNFYRFRLVHDGRVFNCVEQAYQFEKAQLYNCEDIGAEILGQRTGYKAWAIAKQVKVDDRWEKARVDVMRRLIRAKAECCPQYRRKLMSCKGLIVEAVTSDLFWSAGMNENTLRKVKQENWPGQNMMGKLHMELRDSMLHDVKEQPTTADNNAPPSKSANIEATEQQAEPVLTDAQLSSTQPDTMLPASLALEDTYTDLPTSLDDLLATAEKHLSPVSTPSTNDAEPGTLQEVPAMQEKLQTVGK